MPENHPVPSYHPHIDGLRAIAVVSVVLFHLEPTWLPGGFTGVDVFFVISGFVISGSLDNRDLRGFGQFVSYFYSRRLKRILPALLVCVLVTSLFAVLFTIPGIGDGRIYLQTAIYSLFGFSNLVLYNSAQNYFAQSTELNPFTHTWSLAVEEQFYFIFPLLFYAWATGNRTARSRLVSSGLFGVGLLGSLAYAIWSSVEDPSFAFYSIFSRFWELAIGVLLYQRHAVKGLSAGGSAAIRSYGAALSLCLLVAGLCLADANKFPIPWVILPVVGTAGLLFFLISLPVESGIAVAMHRFLASMPMVYIGRLSYSLYLWHWPVIVLAKWTVGLEGVANKLACVFLILCLTLASYYLVEQPLRRLRPGWAKTDRWPLYAGVGAILVSIGLVWSAFRVQDQVSLSVTSDRSDWYPTAKVLPGEHACGSTSARRHLPAGSYRVFSSECSSDDPKQLFVLGDSHAWAYLPMMRTLAAKLPLDVFVFSKGACLIPEAIHQPNAYAPECGQFASQAVQKTLELLNPGDLIFFPGSRNWELLEQLRVGENHPKPLNRAADPLLSVQELKVTLAGLLERSAIVVLEGPKPVFGADPYRCVDWFNQSNVACDAGFEISRDRLEAFSSDLVSEYQQLAAVETQIELFHPLEGLCSSESCSAFQGARPLLYDSNHLSRYGNQVLLEGFERQVLALIHKNEK